MSVKLESELELLSRASKDPDAFGSLYDHYYSRIYNYVRFRVIDPDITDDLTSITFEKALSRMRFFNPSQGSFSAWLFSISHNVVIDYFRESGRRNTVSLDGIQEIASIRPNPEEAAILSDFKSKLLQALGMLQDRERNILALKFNSGMTNRKIAELTGLSEGNVAVILFRSLIRLRQILNGLGVLSYE